MYSINAKLCNYGYTGRDKIGQQSIFYRQGMIKIMEYIVSITYFLTTTISYTLN